MNHFYRKNQIANFEKRKKLSCNDMNSLVSLFLDIDGYNRFGSLHWWESGQIQEGKISIPNCLEREN